jgi:hypothetical protein
MQYSLLFDPSFSVPLNWASSIGMVQLWQNIFGSIEFVLMQILRLPSGEFMMPGRSPGD